MNTKVAKVSTELIEYVNIRLNDYATMGQISNLRTQMGRYTPLEEYSALKEHVTVLKEEILDLRNKE